MELFQSPQPMCPRDQHCSEWVRKCINYCLCSTRDGISLTLGLVSVISWGIAEIPQIITNYKQKSTEGLSVAFLLTWILGDLFNLFGCMLEPATLPTQYYMAMLYALTTLILALQTVYYRHIYHRLKANRRCPKYNHPDIVHNNGVSKLQASNADGWKKGTRVIASEVHSTSPIPLPALPRDHSHELYYMSARSLSCSPVPTMGSFPVPRRSLNAVIDKSPTEEPLLAEHMLTRSAPPSNTKTLLCVATSMTLFFCTFTLQHNESSRVDMVSDKTYQGVVIHMGRKLLQVSGSLLPETRHAKSSGTGTFFGWGMATIYMGGRLPQICLNMKRGNVEGLNPLMFVFALVGNATYVSSILVNSVEWSKIRPNMPWLVDAGGCVLLDTFILLQFIYFRCWSHQCHDINYERANSTQT